MPHCILYRHGVPQHHGMAYPQQYRAGPDASEIAAQVMRYEAVHPFGGWEDLRARLAPDRRVFAFFHARRAAQTSLHERLRQLLPVLRGSSASRGAEVMGSWHGLRACTADPRGAAL
jgi:hypothetical protein